MGWTKQFQTPGARYISPKSQKNHNSLNQETGQADDKANPKRRLAQHARPHRGLANEHQGTEEAKLQRQKKQEAYFGVVGLNNGRGAKTMEDGSNGGCQDDAEQGQQNEDDAHGLAERQELFNPCDAFHLVFVGPVGVRAFNALGGACGDTENVKWKFFLNSSKNPVKFVENFTVPQNFCIISDVQQSDNKKNKIIYTLS